LRPRAVSAGARVHRMPDARSHGRREAREDRHGVHVHDRQPRPGGRAPHGDGGRRPRRRRPHLSPGDRLRRGRDRGRRARAAHIPPPARGGREPQLLLEGHAGMKDRVAVIGVGCTKFGERYDRGYEELICDAAFAAYDDAGVDPTEIEAGYLGTYLPGPGGGKSATSLADALRLYGRPIPRVENYGATGTDAFRNACLAVAAGVHDIVLVLGAEKLKDRGGRGIPRLGHPPLARGNTAPGLFALAANRYMHTFGLGRETLAKVAVKNHANGAKNEKAHLRMEVTEEQVLKAPIIAWPFGLLDCCPTTDGAAAAIICRADRVRRSSKARVLVKGAGLAVTTGRPYFDPTFDYLGFRLTQAAARQAYAAAGITAADVDFAEVHDCFTWTEISNIEDLGFCKKGEGGKLVEEGRTALEGDIPVNPSGGLKSFGHPIGASGVRMIYECVTQLRGEAGPRQVKDPGLGLAHNVGGPGAVSCVVVLGRS